MKCGGLEAERKRSPLRCHKSSSRSVSRTLVRPCVGIAGLSGWSPEGRHCGPKQAKQIVSCLHSMRTLCCHWVSKRQQRVIGQWADGSSMVLFQIEPQIHAGFILFLQQSTIVSTPLHPGGPDPAAALWCTYIPKVTFASLLVQQQRYNH